MSPDDGRRSSRWSAVAGALAVLFFVGTFVFAIVAQMFDPPLPPSGALMYWQALWNGGYYGAKYNFAVTWFCTLAALCGPVMLIGLATEMRKIGRAPAPTEPGWHAIAVAHMGRGAMVRLGLVSLAIGLGFGAICLWDPELVAPVGFIAQIVLIVWPFTLVAGPAVLLDALAPGAVSGPIEALEHIPGAQGQRGVFRVRVGGRSFDLAEPAWRSLGAGDRVFVAFSPAFDRVVDLRVKPAGLKAARQAQAGAGGAELGHEDISSVAPVKAAAHRERDHGADQDAGADAESGGRGDL